MSFTIEKNASSPPDRKGNWGKWQKKIKEMDVGDAAVFEDDENLTSYHGLRRAAISLGFKVVMRTLDDGTIKVWKLDAEAEAAE
tara:strand:+ start:654 stop:905 length:252 start_codon:yes stop_codon:yes gene_type:complete